MLAQSTGEFFIIQTYRELPSDQKAVVLEFITALSAAHLPELPDNVVSFPAPAFAGSQVKKYI